MRNEMFNDQRKTVIRVGKKTPSNFVFSFINCTSMKFQDKQLHHQIAFRKENLQLQCNKSQTTMHSY